MEEAAGIEDILKSIRKADLNADDALKIVSFLKNSKLIDVSAVKNTGQGAVSFIHFLETFWDYDKSEYIQDKLAHGHGFTRTHARKCHNRLIKDLKPFFGETKLNAVTTDDLKRLTKQLADRGLATATINQTLLVCTTALKWSFNQKIIPSDPSQGLSKFAIRNKKRGVLTTEEARALFLTCKDLWEDKRAYAGSLLAASTGARQGECLAIRRSDIGDSTINISHSYSLFDGLKCPKNGEERIVPLLPIVRNALLELLKDNPHLEADPPVADPFVFYSLQADKPCNGKVLLYGLIDVIEKVNYEFIENAKKDKLEKPEIAIDRKGRKIDFHSWRHFFCSKSTQKISGEKVAKVSGHLTKAVFDRYADHADVENVREVGAAISEIFEEIIPSNIIQFPEKKAV